MRFIKLAVFTLWVIGLTGCGNHENHGAGHQQGVVISDSYVRVPPRAGTVAAGYFTVSNHGAASAELLSVTSDGFGDVQMHETVMTDGMMQMNQLSKVEIAAGASVEFKPGGHHLMLMGAVEPITADQQYSLVFEVKRGDKVERQVVVFQALPFGESPVDHSGMKH